MAYAHANRSAALYRKEFYKECLSDIDAALSLGYPEDKKEKLIKRGQKALEKIQSENCKICFKKTEKFDPFENNSNDKINSKFPLIQNIQDSEKPKEDAASSKTRKEVSSPDSKSSSSPGTSEKPRYIKDEGELSLTYGPNEEAPAVSAGVSICFSEKYGRHLIARKNFEPGDIISIEDPFACIIYQDK